jgi:hypothetical protein
MTHFKEKFNFFRTIASQFPITLKSPAYARCFSPPLHSRVQAPTKLNYFFTLIVTTSFEAVYKLSSGDLIVIFTVPFHFAGMVTFPDALTLIFLLLLL